MVSSSVMTVFLAENGGMEFCDHTVQILRLELPLQRQGEAWDSPIASATRYGIMMLVGDSSETEPVYLRVSVYLGL